nr:hypothetical protein CFP56_20976 [Quercus suber]
MFQSRNFDLKRSFRSCSHVSDCLLREQCPYRRVVIRGFGEEPASDVRDDSCVEKSLRLLMEGRSQPLTISTGGWRHSQPVKLWFGEEDESFAMAPPYVNKALSTFQHEDRQGPVSIIAKSEIDHSSQPSHRNLALRLARQLFSASV